VPESELSHRLVALEDVLRLLDEAGALPSDVLARKLKLRRLEVRMVLLHAHWHGLVRASRDGEWTITELGHQALAGELAGPGLGAQLSSLRARASAFAWRRRLRPGYVARGGVSLALAAVVCVAGVAVASSNLPTFGPPALPPVHHLKRSGHHHRRHLNLTRHTLYTATAITSRVQLERSRLTVTVTRLASLPARRVRERAHTPASGCRRRQAGCRTARGSGRHGRVTTTVQRS
jgi:hypothetical protein